ETSCPLRGRGGAMVCMGNILRFLPAWRGRLRGPSVKELLLALSIRRFLASPADVLAGTMRNNRGMNVLGYELGFTPVFEGAIHHGVEVDLVALYRNLFSRGPRPSESQEWVEELWSDARRRSNHEGRSRKVHRRALRRA